MGSPHMGKRGDLGSAHGDGDDRDGSDELAQSVEHQLALPCDELLEEALDAFRRALAPQARVDTPHLVGQW